MKRGEIWTASGGAAYAGKPRPVVLVQNMDFDSIGSITVCPLTSDPRDAYARVVLEPSTLNGLRSVSRVMVDKISTLPVGNLGVHVGELTADEMLALNRAILVFLGLAG